MSTLLYEILYVGLAVIGALFIVGILIGLLMCVLLLRETFTKRERF